MAASKEWTEHQWISFTSVSSISKKKKERSGFNLFFSGDYCSKKLDCLSIRNIVFDVIKRSSFSESLRTQLWMLKFSIESSISCTFGWQRWQHQHQQRPLEPRHPARGLRTNQGNVRVTITSLLQELVHSDHHFVVLFSIFNIIKLPLNNDRPSTTVTKCWVPKVVVVPVAYPEIFRGGCLTPEENLF